MNRRTYLTAAAAAALLVAAALPALAAPSAAGCVTVKDATGDTAPLADPSLDLTGFSLAGVGPRLVASVTVVKESVRPMYAPDSRTEVNFTVGGKRVTLFVKNSLQRAQEANAFSQQGIRIDDLLVPGAVDVTIEGPTLTIKVKNTVLRGAVGAAVVGVPFTAVEAVARANYVHQSANVTYDTASAPASLRFVNGARCSR